MRYRCLAPRAVPLAAAIAAVAVCAPLLAAETSETPDAHESYDAYRILLDRNIFVRNRRPPMPDRPYEPRPTENRPPPGPRLVLTGTARSGDGFIAFFEDERTGETRRADVGKTVAGVLLKAITLDGVQIEDEGTTRTITIGSDLSGRAVVLPARSTTVSAPPAPAAPADTTEEQAASETAEGTPEGGEEPEGEKTEETQEDESAGDGDTAGDIAEILEHMRRRREEELRR
ncbi:MAG: hypothetical protein R6X20_11420 [Phycisphaerae bacterium]